MTGKKHVFWLGLGMALKLYTAVAKGLRVKVRHFEGLISTFVEIIGEELIGSLFVPYPK